LERRAAAISGGLYAAVVGDRSISGSRGALERRAAGPHSRKAALVGDRSTARGRTVLEEYLAVVGEGCQISRRRAVRELYHPKAAFQIISNHKVLCDSRIVRDANAADGQREPGAARGIEGADREGARTRVEHDAVDLRIGREEDVGDTGGRERCRVRGPVGNYIPSPVGYPKLRVEEIPVPVERTCLPGRALGLAGFNR